MKKHIIWQDAIYYSLESFFGDDLEELQKEHTEEELYDLMYEMNMDYLDDERANLNIQLNQPIIAIADLGLWNGTVMGYKEIKSANIRNCLRSDEEYVTWYVDKRGDLACTEAHHDGVNHIIYRAFKDDVTETQRENLKRKIYLNTATRKDITRFTRRLGDEIAKVYGWEN